MKSTTALTTFVSQFSYWPSSKETTSIRKELRKTQEVYRSSAHKVILHMKGANMLVTKLLEDENAQAVQIAKLLINEYQKVKTEKEKGIYRLALSFISYFSTKSPDLTEKEIKTLANPSFLNALANFELPSFEQAIATFPDIKKFCEETTDDFASRFYGGLRLIFLQGIQKTSPDFEAFQDPLTNASYSDDVVHLIPGDRNNDPINFDTLVQLWLIPQEQQDNSDKATLVLSSAPHSGEPSSPFTGKRVTGYVSAPDVKLAWLHLLCEKLAEMIDLIEAKDYNQFLATSQRYLALAEEFDPCGKEIISTIRHSIKNNDDQLLQSLMVSGLKCMEVELRSEGHKLMHVFVNAVHEDARLAKEFHEIFAVKISEPGSTAFVVSRFMEERFPKFNDVSLRQFIATRRFQFIGTN